MRKIFFLTIWSTIVSSCSDPLKRNEPINYGSNNGKYITIHNTKIYYEEYGQGVPLVLLHPGLGSIENFKDIIPILSDSFRVIIPDAPGHGRSGHADTINRQLLADFSSELIDKLQLDSVHVLGWSKGGITALILAANRPDKVKKIISGGSNTTLDGITSEGLELMHAYTIEAIEEDKEWLKNYQRLNPEPGKWKEFVTSNIKMCLEDTAVTQMELRSINIPALIIRGDRELIKLEHSTQIYKSIPKGQLCVYPNAGHNIPSEHAETFSKLAVDFLKSK